MSEMYKPICRICLTEDGCMNVISNTKLQNVYEKLTNGKVPVRDREVLLACQYCHSGLRKCHQLMMRALKAEEILQGIITRGVEEFDKYTSTVDRHSNNLAYNLAVNAICHLTIEPEDAVCNVIVKNESRHTQDNILKNDISESIVQNCKEEANILTNGVPISPELEKNCKENTEDVFLNDTPLASDSEDDLPLTSLCKNARFKERLKMKEKVRKKRDNDFKVDATEIVLTKEQQLEEIQARAKTINYLNSPLKCEICYKGYIDSNAYENHMEKHDQRSGPHECDVCRMRYVSARHLRMHASSAHERRYRCNRCPHTSHTRNQAREHEKWHGGHTYKCLLCGQKFRKSTSYLTHLRKSHPTEHVCNICGHSCLGRHGLRMHKSKMHKRVDEHKASEEPSSDYFCGECNVQFLSSEAWKRHILTSLKHALGNESNPQCKICGEQLESGPTLARHMREHGRSLRKAAPVASSGAKLTQLPCELCDVKFVSQSKLSVHVKRIHFGMVYNKNLVCEVCGRKCVSNASLRYHQRTHTGERPYSCERCGKRFSDSNQLRIHTRTHTGERPYCCAACGRRFSQKPALNRHYRIHTGAKPYECSFCSKTFSQSNSMKLHVRTVHLKQAPNRNASKTHTAPEG